MSNKENKKIKNNKNKELKNSEKIEEVEKKKIGRPKLFKDNIKFHIEKKETLILFD